MVYLSSTFCVTFFIHFMFIIGYCCQNKSSKQIGENSMLYWKSIIPFILIIMISIKTKQVIVGLGVGLLFSTYLINPTLLGGFNTAVDYIINNLAIRNNLLSVGFIYIFAGIINLIKESGGIKGFVQSTSHRIKTRKQTLWLIWLTVFGTFSTPTLRIVAVAPIVKALQKRVDATKERLSFLIEATALPVIALMPVATAFIGYMVSTINLSLKNANLKGNGYQLFIQSIPYNLFAIFMLIVGLIFTIFGHPKIFKHVEKVREEDDKKVYEDCIPDVSRELESRPINLYIPILTTIILTVFLSWYSGYQKTNDLLTAFFYANIGKSMFIAICLALIITVIILLIEKYPLDKIIDDFFKGSNQLMSAIVIFALVWALSEASEKLGLSIFITSSLNFMPRFLLAPMFFITGSLLGYFIGSSWGVWGILMPIGFSIATLTKTPLPLFIGITFACGTLGGLLSPLSGNTIAMARIMELDIVDYSKYKLKHVIIPFVLSLIGYFILFFIF